MYARYTVVLKTIMDNPELAPKLNKALSTYPMYEPKSKNEYIPKIVPSRSELNQKILNHYKYREIGFETVGRFLDELEISMNEIMPYYNQLYFTADQDYNIIYNVDYVKTIDTDRSENTTDSGNVQSKDIRTENETSTGETTSTGSTNTNTSESSSTESTVNAHGRDITAETPQGPISEYAQNMSSVTHADTVKWTDNQNTDSASTEGTSEGSTTSSNTGTSSGETERTVDGTNTVTSSTSGQKAGSENIIETTKGNFGVVSAQDLIQKYRDIILNIDQMIMNDSRIKELFMMVY